MGRLVSRVLIIVQNLPVPFDRRVWLECQALVSAGHQVAVVLRAYHGYLMPGRDKRLALQPDSSVEGHREVLDDDQDAAHRPKPLLPVRDSVSARVMLPAQPRPIAATFIASPHSPHVVTGCAHTEPT